MGDIYSHGNWQVDAANEEAFRTAWLEFVDWAGRQPGAGRFRLLRDLSVPGRYASFGDWSDRANVDDWKNAPEFREKLANVLQHVSEFEASEYELAAAAG